MHEPAGPQGNLQVVAAFGSLEELIDRLSTELLKLVHGGIATAVVRIAELLDQRGQPNRVELLRRFLRSRHGCRTTA